jgi:hypothetical protein
MTDYPLVLLLCEQQPDGLYFQGLGEVIRGDINTFADSVTGTDKPGSKNHAVAQRGVDEFDTGKFHHSGREELRDSAGDTKRTL